MSDVASSLLGFVTTGTAMPVAICKRRRQQREIRYHNGKIRMPDLAQKPSRRCAKASPRPVPDHFTSKHRVMISVCACTPISPEA